MGLPAIILSTALSMPYQPVQPYEPPQKPAPRIIEIAYLRRDQRIGGMEIELEERRRALGLDEPEHDSYRASPRLSRKFCD